ncbi:MAG TPA: hypothetical protein VK629_15945 [Steroidobacteraceae bacterium]|nr:hypothetical protein [Steroidobacteraceae bacterium]
MSGRLTRRKILASNKPPGFLLLATFLDEVEEGKVSLTDCTKKLCKAFEAIAEGGDPLAALQLKWARGKKPQRTLADYEKDEVPICAFIFQQIRKDAATRGATTRAISAATKKFHKGTRQIEDYWRTGKIWAKFEARLADRKGETAKQK